MPRLLLLAAAMSTSLLVLGSVGEEGLMASAIVVIALVILMAVTQLRSAGTTEARVASVALWSLAGYDAIQLVPLPPAMLRFLSPHAAKMWADTDSGMGTAAAFHPMTLDLHATTFAVATAVVVAAFFDVCMRYSGRSAARLRLVGAIVAVVLLVDLVSIGHPLLGLEKLYGFYEPRVSSGQHLLLGPLLNANHAAAVAAVVPPLLVGWALEAKTSGGRVIALVGAVASGAVTVMTLSRSGMAVLAFESLAMAGYAVLRKGGVRRKLSGAGLAILAAAGAIGAPVYIALEPVSREAHDTNLTKLHLIAEATHMIPDFRWMGAGRGAFISTFAAYDLTPSGLVRFTHVECWPVQLAIDVGLPVALAFIGTVGWVVIRCAPAAAARPVAFGALVALVGLGIHDLADFSMEFAGVGMIGAALLAVVVTSRPAAPTLGAQRTARSSRQGTISNVTRSPVTRAVAGVLALVLSVFLMTRHFHHDVDEDSRALAKIWGEGRLGVSQSSIDAAARRHPAEPYFPMLTGIRLIETADAAPYFLRAVKLGPSRPTSHFWLARWFVIFGHRGQAWAEYRETLRLSHFFSGAVLEDMIAANAPIEDIVATASDAATLDEAADRLEKRHRLADAAALDEFIIERYPPAIDARSRKIARALAAGDTDLARELSKDLLASAPDDPRSYLLGAKVAPDAVSAESILDEGLVRLGAQRELLEELILLRGTRLGPAAVASEISRLRALLLANEGHAEQTSALLGDIELARKHPAAAVSHYIDAAAAAPGGEAYLEKAAEIAEANGQLQMAESLYLRLVAHHPDIAGYQLAADRVRQALSSHIAPPALSSPLP